MPENYFSMYGWLHDNIRMVEVVKLLYGKMRFYDGCNMGIERILVDPSLPQKIAELVQKSNQTPLIFPVEVDYSLSLNQMIKEANLIAKKIEAGGGSLDFAEAFPIEGKGKHKVNLRLVTMGCQTICAHVREQLNKDGLEPARIEHLLAFAKAYPTVQMVCIIIALGSIKEINRPNVHGIISPKLGWLLETRNHLDWAWSDDHRPKGGFCHFLVIAK